MELDTDTLQGLQSVDNEKDLFEKLEPIEMPFIGEDFVIRRLGCLCPACGAEIENFRGKIWMSFSVLEHDIVGKCPNCSKLHWIRARFNLKTGRSYYLENGSWRECVSKSFSDKFWENTFKNDLYGGAGFCIGTLLSFCCGQTINIKESAFMLAVTMLFCMIVGCVEARRK